MAWCDIHGCPDFHCDCDLVRRLLRPDPGPALPVLTRRRIPVSVWLVGIAVAAVIGAVIGILARL